MSINRVKFDIQGYEYTLPINPLSYDNHDNIEYKKEETVDHGAVTFAPFFDSRSRKMEWRRLPNKVPYSTMVSTLKSAIGISGVRVNHQGLNIAGTVDYWQNIYVENVDVRLNDGAGPGDATSHLRYDVTLVFRYVI
jgi:hypothetical protein